MKSPILGDHHHHHHCTTWRDAMVRKVTIAQTQVRRIWQDFNPMAMADGANTFPSTMFQRWNVQHRRCDSEGWHHQPHSLECHFNHDWQCKSGCRSLPMTRSDLIMSIANAGQQWQHLFGSSDPNHLKLAPTRCKSWRPRGATPEARSIGGNIKHVDQ